MLRPVDPGSHHRPWPGYQPGAGRDAVEVLAPLGAAVSADPGNQLVPVLIVIQQMQQLPALGEAVLLRDGEVLIVGLLDCPFEIARLFGVTGGSASPCTANERTSL